MKARVDMGWLKDAAAVSLLNLYSFCLYALFLDSSRGLWASSSGVWRDLEEKDGQTRKEDYYHGAI